MTGETLKAYEQMLAKAYDTGSEDYLTGTRHSWYEFHPEFDVRQAYLRGYDDAKACGQLHELTKR
ncbi:hypothetical protein [Mesorhizobium sp. M1C.F.Ca.ET.144.01.1.1]|uniref:hypothetical protein n=1 Tax=Mesorhizobium sp. M1C.F.Ca.ET.144.01.1.1 TaxID=2563921 RepID=UPI00109289EF|nr:hypothetical protein [Mesorhizobium sp. M1C.F.Ca.ET.144.01.1.1]TGP50403.1 hypothetical protein EN873_24865 [bacterium M00.F.Ca.ET.230.01.1.1]